MNEDNGNGKIPPQVDNQETKVPKDKVLTITFKATGEFSVEGPGNGGIFDEPFCDFMMKKAGRFIENSNARATQSLVQRPNQQQGGIMNFARNRFGRK